MDPESGYGYLVSSLQGVYYQWVIMISAVLEGSKSCEVIAFAKSRLALALVLAPTTKKDSCSGHPPSKYY